jgi:hypothetical protein
MSNYCTVIVVSTRQDMAATRAVVAHQRGSSAHVGSKRRHDVDYTSIETATGLYSSENLPKHTVVISCHPHGGTTSILPFCKVLERAVYR